MRYFLILFVFFAGLPAFAQDTAPREIVVTGEGRVSAAPDMATIMIGVMREARTAGEAMAAASEAASAVLAELAASGIEPRDIQTANIGLNPSYQHSNDGRAPRITGYIASNDLTVRVRDLATLGAVLDAAVADGANGLNGLFFGIADESALEDEARRNAVADARAKAETLAEAAGVQLGAVRAIHLGGQVAVPFAGARMDMMEASMAAPVAAGELDIRQSVSMIFAIAD